VLWVSLKQQLEARGVNCLIMCQPQQQKNASVAMQCRRKDAAGPTKELVLTIGSKSF
jgi:hypothetical protein